MSDRNPDEFVTVNRYDRGIMGGIVEKDYGRFVYFPDYKAKYMECFGLKQECERLKARVKELEESK